jgi:hypothetical protein
VAQGRLRRDCFDQNVYETDVGRCSGNSKLAAEAIQTKDGYALPLDLRNATVRLSVVDMSLALAGVAWGSTSAGAMSCGASNGVVTDLCVECGQRGGDASGHHRVNHKAGSVGSFLAIGALSTALIGAPSSS